MKISKAFSNSFADFFKIYKSSLTSDEINNGFLYDFKSLQGDWINVGQDIKTATNQFAITRK